MDVVTRNRPWIVLMVALAGLLLLLTVAGLIGLYQNQRVRLATEQVVEQDARLAERGEELRTAVLYVRRRHDNLVLTRPTRRGLAEFEGSYAELQERISELEGAGLEATGLTPPDRLRAMAGAYYGEFRPAIDLYDTDREAFARASDRGIQRLDELERAAAEIDRLAEMRATAGLESAEQASRASQLVLILVLGSVVAVGSGLVFAAMRAARTIRDLYTRQQALAQELEHALSVRADFIADASHELRTPLTVIRGNAELGARLETAVEGTELFEEIVAEADSMLRLVDDLLFLARSDVSPPDLEMEPVSVEHMLGRLAQRARVLAEHAGAALTVETEAGGLILSDPRRIEQAVLILVHNAAKYGGPGTNIRLRSRTSDGQLVIEVIDDGAGIPESSLPFIFERFYRVDNARRRQDGAGLGLSIARSIIEAHRGRIDAHSRPGEGTRMVIRLPVLSPSPSEEQAKLATLPSRPDA